MPIEFQNPLALLLLLSIPLIIYISYHSLVNISRLRRLLSLTIRILLIILLIFLLADFKLKKKINRLCTIFLVDVSKSIDDDSTPKTSEYIKSAINKKSPDDLIGVILFGNRAVIEVPPTTHPEFNKFSSIVDDTHTNISGAIKLSLAIFPRDTMKRLVLITDGDENIGSAIDDASVVANENIEISVLPIMKKSKNEIFIENLIAPSITDQDELFNIEAVIISNTDIETQSIASLRLFRDNQFIGSKIINVNQGKNIFLLKDMIQSPGFHNYEVILESLDDSEPQNNTYSAYTVVVGKPKILILGEDEDTQFIYNALLTAGLETEKKSIAVAPISLAEFTGYDAIYLNNVPAHLLSQNQMKILKNYVFDLGGGFGMIGGENSFAPGGYLNTPIEETLPVNMQIKDKKYVPSTALIMAIDKSGSMSGEGVFGNKMVLANEAAMAVIDVLDRGNVAGVIAFDSAAKWVVQPTKLQNKEMIKYDIASIRSGGGTDMYPALSIAFRELKGIDAQVKHIIVLSDGRSQPGDFEGVVTEMRNNKITLSTVAVGADSDIELMKKLAIIGQGRYYYTDDPSNIPRIFTRETIMAQKSYIVEKPFAPEIFIYNPSISGIDAFPDLKGYIITEIKDRAEMVLKSGLKEDEYKNNPVLAFWNFGLGKSLAFTSDAKNRWGVDWITWDNFSKFWYQVTKSIIRKRFSKDFKTNITTKNGIAKVTVDAINSEGKYINSLNLTSHIITPDLKSIQIPLQQTASGKYEGSFEALNTGSYFVNISSKGGESITTGFVIPYSPEYKANRTNMFLLKNIAEKTGGKINPDIDYILSHNLVKPRSLTDIFKFLLLCSIILIPLDIASRRIIIERRQLQWILNTYGKLINSIKPKPKEEKRDETLLALKRKKESVQQTFDRRFSFKTQEETIKDKRLRIEPIITFPSITPTQPSPIKGGGIGRGEKSTEELFTSKLLKAKRKFKQNKKSK